MRNLYFDDFEDLACSVADTYDSLKGEDFEDIVIIAKYEDARQVIKELLCIGYDIHSVNIIDEEYGGYDAEYIISLYDDEVWCEPMLRENGYLDEDASIIYILDNCTSKVIPHCKGKNVYEVTVDDDDFEDERWTVNGKHATKEEFDAYVSQFKKNDEKPATTHTTTYKVNGENVDKETYEKVLNELDEKYLDNVQDMLLSYLDFVDEINQLHRFIW